MVGVMAESRRLFGVPTRPPHAEKAAGGRIVGTAPSLRKLLISETWFRGRSARNAPIGCCTIAGEC